MARRATLVITIVLFLVSPFAQAAPRYETPAVPETEGGPAPAKPAPAEPPARAKKNAPIEERRRCRKACPRAGRFRGEDPLLHQGDGPVRDAGRTCRRGQRAPRETRQGPRVPRRFHSGDRRRNGQHSRRGGDGADAGVRPGRRRGRDDAAGPCGQVRRNDPRGDRGAQQGLHLPEPPVRRPLRGTGDRRAGPHPVPVPPPVSQTVLPDPRMEREQDPFRPCRLAGNTPRRPDRETSPRPGAVVPDSYDRSLRIRVAALRAEPLPMDARDHRRGHRLRRRPTEGVRRRGPRLPAQPVRPGGHRFHHAVRDEARTVLLRRGGQGAGRPPRLLRRLGGPHLQDHSLLHHRVRLYRRLPVHPRLQVGGVQGRNHFPGHPLLAGLHLGGRERDGRLEHHLHACLQGRRP